MPGGNPNDPVFAKMAAWVSSERPLPVTFAIPPGQPPQGFAAAASARANRNFDQDQLEMQSESWRMLALGQMIGSSGLPGSNVARFALARQAMLNEQDRATRAAKKRLFGDEDLEVTPGSAADEMIKRQPGVIGAGLQAQMSTFYMATAIITAVDQAIQKIGDAIAGFYRAETGVMTSRLREQGAAIAFDVTGHARAQISTERARMAQDREMFEAIGGWIPIVGSIGRFGIGLNQARVERELQEREQTLDAVASTEQRFRVLAQFNPALATQAAMQDVGRLFRTMDQSRRLGSLYGAFSEQLFQHQATQEEIMARMMPSMMGEMLDRMRRQNDRQIAETRADAEMRTMQERFDAGELTPAEMIAFATGAARNAAIERALEEVGRMRAEIEEMNERDRQRELETAGPAGLLSMRAPGEGRGAPDLEAAREARSAAMRRAAMELPPPGIDLP